MSWRLVFEAGCCLTVDALEDEASPAYSFQLCFGMDCCLTVDVLEDEASPAYSLHVGFVLTIEGPRKVEGKLPERLPDQAEPLVAESSMLWTLEGKLLRGSACTAFVNLPLMMVGFCCCLLGWRRCGGLVGSMATRTVFIEGMVGTRKLNVMLLQK